jgi:PAS domain S-box-containing protein
MGNSNRHKVHGRAADSERVGMLFHPALKRLLGILALDVDRPPSEREWPRFLERLSRCLDEADQRAQSLSDAVIRSLGMGLCVLDATGHLRMVNPEGERLLGRTQAELLGRNLTDVFAPQSGVAKESWQRAVHHRIAAGRAFREAASYATFYGRTVQVTLSVNPILQHGDVVGAVVVFSEDQIR